MKSNLSREVIEDSDNIFDNTLLICVTVEWGQFSNQCDSIKPHRKLEVISAMLWTNLLLNILCFCVTFNLYIEHFYSLDIRSLPVYIELINSPIL